MDITAKIAEELGIRKNQAQAAIQLIDERTVETDRRSTDTGSRR